MYDPAGVMGDIQKKQRYDSALRTGLGVSSPMATPPAAIRPQPPQPHPQMSPFSGVQSFLQSIFGNRFKKEGL